jgi:hypothetical protein
VYDIEGISSPPRRLRPGTTGKLLKAALFPLLFGGIWFMVGAGLGVLFLHMGNPLHDYRLSRSCEVAEGTVTEVALKRTTRVNGRNPWVIGYRFTAGGREWKGRSFTLYRKVAARMKSGRPVEVEYLSDKPTVNRAKGTTASVFPAAVFLVPLFFAMAGGIIFLCGKMEVLRLRSLLVNGEAAVAAVTDRSRAASVRAQRRRPIRISYEFEDSRGTTWGGVARLYFRPPGLDVASIKEVKIVYDRHQPGRNFACELHGINLSSED